MDLAERRLIIVAGKGGVGKTTTSCAIALEMARLGRRTLLVTVDPAKRLEDALGVPVGFAETPVQPNLAAMMLEPSKVIKEHLEERLPQARITEHPLFKSVSQNLPGLNELMAIGKLNDLRRAQKYDCIVVDTAPTGHALSFLGAPKAMEELFSDRSLVKWAVRGYAVWQKITGTARTMQNVFRRKEEQQEVPPDIDFEKVFGEIQAEATRIRSFLNDPQHSALVLVTLPEKLPVEETCDLYEAVTEELAMTVHAIVVNKLQPDPLGPLRERFLRLEDDPAARDAFVAACAKASGESPELVQAMLEATRFNDLRRQMNLEHMRELRRRLPAVDTVAVPLWKEDVQGLRRLGPFREALFDPTNKVA